MCKLFPLHNQNLYLIELLFIIVDVRLILYIIRDSFMSVYQCKLDCGHPSSNF